ncbi:DUF998_domain-containing protein [Hexamita inflata]|uniref:DUF998 domain-containing protein n=1 Tax=Hexamita inflata TaxID=28002 RepID=A0AA86U2V7_9EUKA|nr:DUF998 domain-containing protein [Hexamita inflata]
MTEILETATLVTQIIPVTPPTPKKKSKCFIGTQNYFRGQFSAVRLRIHSIIGFGVIFLCIIIARAMFPKVNDYSILHNTFSHLGSYTKDNNPHGWIFFSFSQIISFFVQIPLVSYIRYRVEHVNKIFGRVVTGTMYFGSTCQLLVGFFPATRTIMFGKVMVGAVHQVSAMLGFLIQIIGYYMMSVLITMDRYKCRKNNKKLNYMLVVMPVFVLLATVTLGIVALVTFDFIYRAHKKRDPSIGSNWAESIDTFWSFPLWENIIIYVTYLYYIWLPFTLPLRTDGIVPKQRISQTLKCDLSQIELKTDISKIWFEIISQKKCSNKWKAANFLEHLADYQEVEKLMTDEFVQKVTIISSLIKSGETEQINRIVYDSLKKSDEIRPFKRNLLNFHSK